MILSAPDWFARGRELFPEEDPEQPGRWKCKRCDGGEVECSRCAVEPDEDCYLCQGSGFVRCDTCMGSGYHRTQQAAREA